MNLNSVISTQAVTGYPFGQRQAGNSDRRIPMAGNAEPAGSYSGVFTVIVNY
jgi:hypothetical protein